MSDCEFCGTDTLVVRCSGCGADVCLDCASVDDVSFVECPGCREANEEDAGHPGADEQPGNKLDQFELGRTPLPAHLA